MGGVSQSTVDRRQMVVLIFYEFAKRAARNVRLFLQVILVTELLHGFSCFKIPG
jgi:hypothetical protein